MGKRAKTEERQEARPAESEHEAAADAPEGEFSLGALLGLPTEAPAERRADAEGDALPVVQRWRPDDVQFSLARVRAITADDAAFCVRCGPEEDAELWALSRADVRAELRSRIKLAARHTSRPDASTT